MLIELRKLNVLKALSEETPCYTAEIWIDGQIAFRASNRGHGGADDYHQIGQFSEAEVNAWLQANRPARIFEGVTLEPSLEHQVAVLIDEAEAVKSLRRRLRTNVITIEEGHVYSYPLRSRPATALAGAIRSTKPTAEILNGAEHETLLKAARLILDNDGKARG